MTDRIKVKITIRKNATGEIRTFEDNMSVWLDDGIPNCFMWDEGNYSCDCNRFLFFERAGGLEPDWDEGPCGHDAYSVNIESEDFPAYLHQEI